MYPEDDAVVTWEKDGVGFSIVYNAEFGHYCGYCRFARRPLIEQWCDGIAAYVPVHGGITYAKEREDGTMVYGFDCAHFGDEQRPELKNIEWLKQECQRMALGIKVAAKKYETQYLTAATNEEKAKVIDAYHAELKNCGVAFDLKDNIGAMIKVVFGSL